MEKMTKKEKDECCDLCVKIDDLLEAYTNNPAEQYGILESVKMMMFRRRMQ